MVYLLNESNVDIQTPNQAGGTPLHQATYFGSEMCVNYLLALGANVNIQDNEGFSPLHLSVISANARIIRRLLIYGAEKKLKDKKGYTAYQTAKESEVP